jgi:predicted MFS family arabinose efflux permease
MPETTTPAHLDTGALAVLRTPQTGRLLAASLLGRLPAGAAPLALLIFARETMTLTAAGALVGAYTAGVAVGQPMLARIADRWRQPPIMWLGVTVSTAGFALAAAGPRLLLALVAAVLAGLGAPPFESGLRVLWRDLLPERQVHTAYTLVTAALLQLAGTAWFATAPAVRRWRGEPGVRHWAGPLRAGRLRVILAALLLVGAGVGSVAVAATAYAESAGSRSWSAWLLAAQAVGALTGGLLYVRLGRLRAGNTLLRSTIAFTVGYLPLLLTPALPGMLPLMALSGLALPPLLTVAFVTIDKVAPAGTAAEAFAWAATAFTVGSALGSAINGSALDASGSVRAGFVLAPVAIALACLILALAARRTPAVT